VQVDDNSTRVRFLNAAQLVRRRDDLIMLDFLELAVE
jgi:hypothetical protein